MMRFPILLTFCCSLAAYSQTNPDPLDILLQTARTYRQLNSYYVEGSSVVESVSDGSQSRNETRMVIATISPSKKMVELRAPGRSITSRVFDGQTVWEYKSTSKQYSKKDQASYERPRMDFVSNPIENYGTSLAVANSPVYVREDVLDVAGSKIPCHVIEVPSRMKPSNIFLESSPTTYWIDKVRRIVLREASTSKIKFPSQDEPMTQTTTKSYTVIRLNEPVDEKLFVFTPPEGASEVAEISPSGGRTSSLLSKPAPEFSLKDLDGTEIALKDLRGKTVLLNFWATWCAPCREQMPQIQSLSVDFKDKGLIVLGVNYNETESVAKKYFADHKYSFGSVLDPEKLTSQKYGVTGIPVVVLIDKTGVVRFFQQGYNSSQDFAAEVRKLGL